MREKREQVFVGLFVVVATLLLMFTIFTLTGAFAGSDRVFHVKLTNAAGLEPGASVHYVGGSKIGRVTKMTIDPADPAKIDMTFSVNKEVPVKTDSRVSIMSFSPLGDNHLEIKAGSPQAPLASPGSTLQADPYVGFNDLTARINDLAPQAQQLLNNLNERVTQLKVTVDRVNDLLNDKNRANISGSLDELHGILKENRPQLKSTLANVNAASEKIQPLIDKLHVTLDQANASLKHVDEMLGENREGIHDSIQKLRASLNNINSLTSKLDNILDGNTENIDELLNNLREVSENLRDFTETLKRRPSSLIRTNTAKDRRPGEQP